jgi:hypothetical protein
MILPPKVKGSGVRSRDLERDRDRVDRPELAERDRRWSGGSSCMT